MSKLRWLVPALLVFVSACGHATSAHLTSGGGSASAGPPTSASPSEGTPSATRPVPAVTPTPAPSLRPAQGSGIEGKVQAGPTCPVERPDQPCPPRPVSTDVVVRDHGGHVVARTQSGSDGLFRVAVASGSYVVSANSSGKWPTCRPTDVTVYAKHYSTVTIDCDTGIR